MDKIIQDSTILVLEDERPLLQAIKKKLEDNSFDVVTARSVQQAKEYISELGIVHAVWLDHYVLGKEDGLDFVAWLKNKKELQHIPIFVVSNTASPDKQQAYIEFGITKYYTKSDNRLEDIIRSIKESLENNQS